MRKDLSSGPCLGFVNWFVSLQTILFLQKILQEVQLNVTDLESAYTQGGSTSLISRARLAAVRKAKRKESVKVNSERGALQTPFTQRQATFSLARHDHISFLTFYINFLLLWAFEVDPNCILNQDCSIICSKVYRHRLARTFANWQESRRHMPVLRGHKYTSR